MLSNRLLSVLNKADETIFAIDSCGEHKYCDLALCVKKLTVYLRDHKHSRVVLYISQGFEGYAAIIASYLAGVTFCIISPELPKTRVDRMLDDFHPDLIIASNMTDAIKSHDVHLFKDLIDSASTADEIYVNKAPNEETYVMFTSGSSGTPKGCRILREAVEKVCAFVLDSFPFYEGLVYGQYVPLHFDMSLIDVFCGISIRARLISFDTLPKKLRPAKAISRYGIEFMNVTPQFIDILIKSDGLHNSLLSSLKAIRFGGDKLYKTKASLLFDALPELLIISTYGATETTMFCFSQMITKETLNQHSCDIVTIGRPIPGWNWFLKDVDSSGIGELVIWGNYIGCGYLNDYKGGYSNCATDQQSFRLYSTGDFFSLINKQLFFKGRNDAQIKINGQRGSLTEIETAMIEFGASEATAIVCGESIVCFYVNPLHIDADIFTKKLTDVIPTFMMPRKIIEIKKLPYTPNGKIDKQVLLERGDLYERKH